MTLSIPDISLLYHKYISPFLIKKKRKKELLFSLKMNTYITSLIEQIHLYKEDNVLFAELPKIKTIELFILLKHSYKAENLFCFLSCTHWRIPVYRTGTLFVSGN